ncbi:MAG TPA: hypothetical protein P5235_06555 [Saprospiraceae bacterium]|nr:hypothetical protein [Saprospiraceae bacterium]
MNTKFFVLLMSVTALFLSSCSNRTLYMPGVEGLDTSYEPKQKSGTVGMNYQEGASSLNLSAAYSPMNHLGLIYNGVFCEGIKYMDNTIGVGAYTGKYRKYTPEYYSEKKSEVDLGYHFDFYAGFSLHQSKNVRFDQYFFLGPSGSMNSGYGLSLFSKKYFLQTGIHIKKTYITYDFALRYNWMDMDKIETFDLIANEYFNPAKELTELNILHFGEFSFRVGFGGEYKPVFIGFTRRFGYEQTILADIFAPVTGTLGFNQNIFYAFGKKKKKLPEGEN